MDDLNKMLTEILQDPDRMRQITEMANSLGLSPQAMPEQLTEAVQKTEVREQRQETLMRALLPYLKPARKMRLERAMQLSRLSIIAGAALRNAQLSIGDLREEESNV